MGASEQGRDSQGLPQVQEPLLGSTAQEGQAELTPVMLSPSIVVAGDRTCTCTSLRTPVFQTGVSAKFHHSGDQVGRCS